jgi:ABC-type phosphate/phosphonate transport system substrate-binding protein
MIKCLIRCLLASLLTFGVTQSNAVQATKEQKELILIGGSTWALRNATKQDAELAFNAVLDEAVHNPDIKVHVRVYTTTEDLYAAFDSGEIDGFFGSPLEFIGRMDQLGEESMALAYKDGAVRQHLVLIARNNDTPPQLSELKNKRLTLAKFQDVEALYLNTLLLKNQLPEAPDFFLERLDAKNSNVAIMDVFFNKSDATIVRESEFQTAIELNPQIGKKLVVLDKSPAFLPALGAVRKTFDRKKIRNLMSEMEVVSDANKGSKILSIIQAKSVVSIQREEMRSVLDLVKEYEVLKKLRAQKAIVTPKPKARERRHAY